MPAGLPPDESLARYLVTQAVGVQPMAVHRFPTGLMHYVFEATFDAREPVVIRMAGPNGRAAMLGAARLSRLLRPRGVPLPEILAADLEDVFPYLILERLPGSDLGEVIGNLSPDCLQTIATAVVDAQRATAGLPSAAEGFGFAVSSEEAPHANWSQVLASGLARSRRWLAAAGIFDVRETGALATILTEMDRETRAIPATPFLHDTTTKNVIVTPEGRFSGIVDVDDLCFGDPRYVVALTRASLLARRIPVDYTDIWMRIAGFAPDRLFRVYVALFLADFMGELGQSFNGNEPRRSPESEQRLHQIYLDTLAQL